MTTGKEPFESVPGRSGFPLVEVERLRGALPEGSQASGFGAPEDETLLGRVAFVFLDGRPEVLRSHMSKRTGHFMPVSMLDSQLATLERPRGEPLVLRQDVIETADCIMAASTKWLRGIAF